jgi:anti-anti-sigma regulatory factor
MSIYRWSEDVIVADLPEDLGEHHELKAIIGTLRQGHPCDIVLDFSRVQVVGGVWLTQLRTIQRLVHESGHKLTLCNVPPAIRGVFTIAHVDELFEVAEDKFTVLASPQMVG